MSKLQIEPVRALSDNYAYLLHEESSKTTAVVDPSEASPVLKAANKRGWQITHILNTHHHYDHVGGNLAIKEATGCTIMGSKLDERRIPGIDRTFEEGDLIALGEVSIQVLHIPGHTLGHVAFWIEEEEAVFVGDTLFILGCGRVFEGTMSQMWASLQRLRDLPHKTRVYCGHEYTLKNAAFAKTLDAQEPLLDAYAQQAKELIAQGMPTVPSTLFDERHMNPFMRCDEPAYQDQLGLKGQSAVEVFTVLRGRKDNF